MARQTGSRRHAMTVDEILNDPTTALNLPDGAIPLSIIIVCEYAEPGSDNHPAARRLAYIGDDDIAPWQSTGMMRWAIAIDMHTTLTDADDDD